MKEARAAVPFWKDERKLGMLFQALLLLTVVLVLLFLSYTAYRGMRSRGLEFSFAFLFEESGFLISEGVTLANDGGHWLFRAFQPSDANWQVLLAGFINTLRVSVTGIVLTTILGVLVGVGRLSSNWLVNRLSFAYVEFVRNTPLLVQMIFWYLAVFNKLPPLRQASEWYGFILSNKGMAVPWIATTPAWSQFGPYFYWGLYLWLGLWLIRPLWRPPRWLYWAAPLGVWAVGLALVRQLPVTVSTPVKKGFRVEGGALLSPEFSAVLLALTIYTASYIAEIVRGAIQSLPKGQWEAASSLGLSYGQTLRLIILPQALRIIVPPLGNQYLNLTKNSSLAIAVGFPELFNVYGTLANQTGRSLEGILIVMAVYLSISLSISAFINWYNTRVALVGVAR
ncbi:amino acid ABC transporter permease [Oceanithermus sp.]